MARDRATDTETLVAAAAEVIRRKGFHNTTIDDIAESVGISRPTVYKYIESKQWLLDRMAAQLEQQMGGRLRELSDTDVEPTVRLRAVITAITASAVADRTLYSIVFSEQTELSEAGRTRFNNWAHEVTENFARLLEECRTQGSAPADLNPWIAANLILTMLTTLYRWYDPSGPVTPEALTEQVLSVLSGVQG